MQNILTEEFEANLVATPSPFKQQRRILKIILFGSYARGDWVEDPAGRYFSDYDLLIIVSHKALTDEATYWCRGTERLLRDKSIKTPINIIVHTLREVNVALRSGQYFFTDILRDGVMLYDLSVKKEPRNEQGHRFVTPRPPRPKEAYKMAREYFDSHFENAVGFLKNAKFSHEQGHLKNAAFLLHQAAEQAYTALLLTLSLYVPKTHNIAFLRSLSEDLAPDAISAWPRDERRDRRLFQLLKRAYVEARYSKHYRITTEELDRLQARVAGLQETVKTVCARHLRALKNKVA